MEINRRHKLREERSDGYNIGPSERKDALSALGPWPLSHGYSTNPWAGPRFRGAGLSIGIYDSEGVFIRV